MARRLRFAPRDFGTSRSQLRYEATLTRLPEEVANYLMRVRCFGSSATSRCPFNPGSRGRGPPDEGGGGESEFRCRCPLSRGRKESDQRPRWNLFVEILA